jgi:class 3 adenylate cyclase/HAMP domain-containing protein
MRWHYKLPLSFILIIAVLAMANVVGTTYALRRLQESRLRTSELLLAESLAGQLYRRIIEQDVAVITQVLFDSKAMAEEKIAYILVFDRKGYLLAHTYIDTMPKQLFDLNHNFSGDKRYRIDRITTDEIRVYDIAVPVMEGIVQVGSIHLGIKQSFIDNAIKAASRASLILTGLVAAFALFVGIIVSRAVTVPIRELCRVSQEVGKGHLDVRANIRSRDDFRELGEAFNTMTADVQRMMIEIQTLAEDLELRNQFIRSIFGRYLSDDIVDQLLEKPEALSLGGEKREVTVLISDLRGFSSICETMPPDQVVILLNNYLGVMTEVISRYGGTINEFLGDAILIIFGAPVKHSDSARRAVACAIDMQLAMDRVNRWNLSHDLPEVAMGVGINTGDVVVGNIGSEKRAKYAVVGTPVNLASRIESYSIGGQVLISQATYDATDDPLRIDRTFEVTPKGSSEPIRVYSVDGISGLYELTLPRQDDEMVVLDQRILLRFAVQHGKDCGEPNLRGEILELGQRVARIRTDDPVEPLANLKMVLKSPGVPKVHNLFAKVIGQDSEDPSIARIFLTYADSEIEQFLRRLTKPRGDG